MCEINCSGGCVNCAPEEHLAAWLEETFRECSRPKSMSKEAHKLEDEEWLSLAREALKVLE